MNKRSKGEKVFNVINITFMVFLCVVSLYPLLFVLALSFNDGVDAMRGGIYLFPRQFTFDNYTQIFQDSRFMNALQITIFRAVVGLALTVLLNSCFAFALSKKDLPYRKLISWFIFIPMYFSGGLIPYFLVCRDLGLYNNIWVYIIPWITMPMYIMMMRAYFVEMPISLEESAMMDGAGYFRIFFQICLPLSLPTLATIALLSGVMHWNDWLDGTIMVSTSRLWPLQTLLLNVIQGAEASTYLKQRFGASGGKNIKVTVEALKMAMLVVTIVPIAMVYPLVQRFFIKGMMIGAVKE